jgi:hypothetical protein
MDIGCSRGWRSFFPGSANRAQAKPNEGEHQTGGRVFERQRPGQFRATLRAGLAAPIVRPLEHGAVERLSTWLPKLSHPVRIGEHDQTVFALGLMLESRGSSVRICRKPSPHRTIPFEKTEIFLRLRRAALAAGSPSRPNCLPYFRGRSPSPLSLDALRPREHLEILNWPTANEEIEHGPRSSLDFRAASIGFRYSDFEEAATAGSSRALPAPAQRPPTLQARVRRSLLVKYRCQAPHRRRYRGSLLRTCLHPT